MQTFHRPLLPAQRAVQRRLDRLVGLDEARPPTLGEHRADHEPHWFQIQPRGGRRHDDSR